MDLYKLLILQITAHFISDYFLQSPKCSYEKDNAGFKTRYLYKHITVTFLFSVLLSFQFTFIIFSLIISGIHLFLDGLKKYFLTLSILKNNIFFIDQILHLATIVGVVFLYTHFFEINFITDTPKLNYLLYILAYVLILKPTNIFIREIFQLYEIELDKTGNHGDELPNAGKLIGIIERILTLTLIFLGEFAAIGFILAAKSILRFKEAQAKKAEYVLIGTMLSFGIAIIIGVTIVLANKII